MATATPREALRFSAELRLPTRSSLEISELVTDTLNLLGISDCADVIIGGGLIKGISGGQKKRTSVGIELISNPSLLLMDEPLSGSGHATSAAHYLSNHVLFRSRLVQRPISNTDSEGNSHQQGSCTADCSPTVLSDIQHAR